MDSVIKVDSKQRQIVKMWSSPGVYVTEFGFAPRTNSTDADAEDDGVLLTILYNSTEDKSYFGIFDAKALEPIGLYALQSVVPFHAHGIICRANERCFTNP